MADDEQLRILKQGVEAWNAWRTGDGRDIPIDLSRTNLHRAKLSGVNLYRADITQVNLSGANLIEAHLLEAHVSGANLTKADLSRADLIEANLSGANLSGANLNGATLLEANLSGANLTKADLRGAKLGEADLYKANLSGANLSGADLMQADLYKANLSGANLSGADLMQANLLEGNLLKAHLGGATLLGATLIQAHLRRANLVEANLSGANLVDADLSEADLTGCRVYGVSAWGLKLSAGTKQQGLIITRNDEPEITTDDIEVAQFLYLLIHNEKLRKVIDTITSKVVLILGRFTKERKAVLDAMRGALRKRDLLPVIFDFPIPESRDVTQTVRVLFGLARFVIADITDATEVRSELNFVPDFPSLPVQPILLRGRPEPVGIPHWRQYPWFLPSFEYDTTEHLLANLDKHVVARAEAKVRKLRGRSHPRRKLTDVMVSRAD
jgi:uncharacterized protein YjbI with pentapeptide repeats